MAPSLSVTARTEKSVQFSMRQWRPTTIPLMSWSTTRSGMLDLSQPLKFSRVQTAGQFLPLLHMIGGTGHMLFSSSGIENIQSTGGHDEFLSHGWQIGRNQQHQRLQVLHSPKHQSIHCHREEFQWPSKKPFLCVVHPTSVSLLSPYSSEYFHWMCLAMANRGWSRAITGFCAGFRKLTAFLTRSMACLIMAGDFDCSWNNGKRLDNPGVLSLPSGCWMAWYAPQEMVSGVVTCPLIAECTVSN